VDSIAEYFLLKTAVNQRLRHKCRLHYNEPCVCVYDNHPKQNM